MRHIALYGSLQIPRDTCPDCERQAFIIGGKFACCDLPAEKEKPKVFKRVVDTEGKRRFIVPKEMRERILTAQENRCFYCFREFGQFYRNQKTKDRLIRLTVQWDHLVPFSWLNDDGNVNNNFVASCRTCNNIKGSILFQTVEDARIYVKNAFEQM
jgi:hypothetical protein